MSVDMKEGQEPAEADEICPGPIISVIPLYHELTRVLADALQNSNPDPGVMATHVLAVGEIAGGIAKSAFSIGGALSYIADQKREAEPKQIEERK